MVFTSPLFLFAFLPLFLLLYYPASSRTKITIILLGSWIFYGFWRIDFLGLLIGVSVLNWFGGYLLTRNRSWDTGQKESQRKQPISDRLLVSVVVVLNLSILGYFKYANFGVQAMNQLLENLGLSPLGASQVILPVGISFYIFQAMSYTIVVYRNDAPAALSFPRLGAYIALFPQLIAGPIVRYKDLAHQLSQPHVSPGRTKRGIRRFIIGFAKKVLIADSLAPMVEGAFQLSHPALGDAWLGVGAYGVQLYLDFAAYSDMAIGLGLMLGFRFRENFRMPYHAKSITEFWQRWHISLSTWLRDYLYIPLGGNRVSPNRTLLNLFLVMTLGGLWHGAAWNFILWGMWHGWMLLTERSSPETFSTTNAPSFKILVLQLRTLLVVFVGWALFRATTLTGALRMIGGMLGAYGTGGAFLSPAYAWQVDAFSLAMLILGIAYISVEGSTGILSASGNVPLGKHWSFGLAHRYLPGLLFVLAIMKLLADNYSPFLYFQF